MNMINVRIAIFEHKIFMIGCFEHDQSYVVSNETKPNYAESEGECQKLCQKDGSCKGFSYDSDRKHCSILAFKDMQRSSRPSYISGPKYCSGKLKTTMCHI